MSNEILQVKIRSGRVVLRVFKGVDGGYGRYDYSGPGFGGANVSANRINEVLHDAYTRFLVACGLKAKTPTTTKSKVKRA